MELILAIAALCSVAPGYDVRSSSRANLDEHQLQCQQWYLQCVYTKTSLDKSEADKLAECLQERRV